MHTTTVCMPYHTTTVPCNHTTRSTSFHRRVVFPRPSNPRHAAAQTQHRTHRVVTCAAAQPSSLVSSVFVDIRTRWGAWNVATKYVHTTVWKQHFLHTHPPKHTNHSTSPEHLLLSCALSITISIAFTHCVNGFASWLNYRFEQAIKRQIKPSSLLSIMKMVFCSIAGPLSIYLPCAAAMGALQHVNVCVLGLGVDVCVAAITATPQPTLPTQAHNSAHCTTHIVQHTLYNTHCTTHIVQHMLTDTFQHISTHRKHWHWYLNAYTYPTLLLLPLQGDYLWSW